MRGLEATIGINESRYFGDHLKVSTEKIAPKKTVPKSAVSVHEAKHAVAAWVNGTAVESMTIEPGPGYLGMTKLSRPDAVAAAAPHATGSDGTSHDVYLIGLMGRDVQAASNAARDIISANQDKVMALAELLEEKRTVDGFSIEHTLRELDNKKDKVKITVEDLVNNERHTEEGFAKRGIVIFDAKKLQKKVYTKKA